MTVTAIPRREHRPNWFEDKILMGQTPGQYLASLFTPFNLVAAIILLVGLYATIVRYTSGLAAATNLSDTYPWGLWIGFDVLSGVALAAGGYTIATTVYIFRLRNYYPLARPAILTGLLGYFFVVIGLLFDLGRPWRLPYPIVISFGMTSVMFSVAWHLFLYLCCLFAEFLPAAFEWLHWDRARAFAVKLTMWVTILGVMLSTLHQAALGGLFLLAPNKLHPLWYSPLLPLFFLISSAFVGLAMVIVECTLSHRIFTRQCDPAHEHDIDGLLLGLAKAAALIMFVYFGLKIMGMMHADAAPLLGTPTGYWFLVETLGFVLLPCFLFAWGAQARSVRLVRFAAVLTVIGVVLNRLNISILVFNWQLSDRYFPAWTEFAITIAIVTTGLLVFRWIVNRMPILRPHPDFGAEH